MDLKFISGEFLDDCLPPNKRYLYKYFATPIQRRFICYMHVFGEWKYFSPHTGLTCSNQNLRILKKKMAYIEESHQEAKKSMDLQFLEEIEKGLLNFH